MNAIRPTPLVNTTHPLVLSAAASVIVLCITGIAALAGWLPQGRALPLPTLIGSAPVAAIHDTPSTATASAPASKAAPAKLGAGEAAPSVKRSPAATRGATAPATTPTASAEESPRVASPPAIDLIPARSVKDSPPPVPLAAVCVDCGVVQAVDEVAVEGGQGKTGAVIGGVVGGIVGNQIGTGATRDIATLLGIAGGALAGQQIEKATRKAVRYDTVVRLEDGSLRRFPSETAPAWRSGDRVKIQNGELLARD